MGDLYNINNSCYEASNNNACSSSNTITPRDHHHHSSDEISLFLHQFLLRSSSSCSSSLLDKRLVPQMMRSFVDDRHQPPPPMGLLKEGILRVDSGDHGGYVASVNVMRGSSATTPAGAGNVSSSSVGGASENENDDFDCESEEGLEVLMDGPTKPTLPRSSSKRSRGAEVHNLSEKRRRSRINEKMKALQNLIPNSNKTDKASMLDEAIDYLKQLQLQVQMLSMRNGVSLHPLCLPGLMQPFQISQSRTAFGEENGSPHMNVTASLPLNEEMAAHTTLRLPNQCPSSNQLLMSSMSNMVNSESAFGFESAINTHFGPFLHQTPSEGICRQDGLTPQHLTSNHGGSNPSEFGMGATATMSLPFETQASNLKNTLSLEACMIGRDQNEGMVLKNIEHNLVLSSDLNSGQKGRSAYSDDIKMERPDI